MAKLNSELRKSARISSKKPFTSPIKPIVSSRISKIEGPLLRLQKTGVKSKSSIIAGREEVMKNQKNNFELRKSVRISSAKTIASVQVRDSSTTIEKTRSKIKCNGSYSKGKITKKDCEKDRPSLKNPKITTGIQRKKLKNNELKRSVSASLSSEIKVTSPIKHVGGLSKISRLAKDKLQCKAKDVAVKKTTPKNKNSIPGHKEDVLKSQRRSLDNDGSTHIQLYKPKLPIWDTKIESATLRNSLTKSRRSSKRLSGLKNDGIYNFSSDFSPGKKSKGASCIARKVCVGKEKRPRQRKPTIKKTKNPFKGTLKPTLLTTDLTWEALLSKNFPVNTFYSKNESKVLSVDVLKTSSIPVEIAETESHSFDDTEVDDAGYEASVSMAYETNDTNISSVNSSENVESNVQLPSYDIGLTFPTPKLTNRYLGTTSTPRGDGLEDETLSKPVCVQEEMKICFGFDEAEECNFGFSPVQRSHYLSTHHISDYISSDTGDIDPQPTRFAVPLNPSFRYPLSQVQNLQYKRRHAPNWNNTKFKKKSTITNHVPNLNNKTPSTSSISQCDQSTLFNCIDENSMEGSDFPEVAPQLDARKENQINSMTILSPAKNFVKPPRKSYTRESIVEVKRKFHAKLAGGYSTADSETETDVDVRKKINKRKKKVKSLKSALINNSAILPPKKCVNGKENLVQKDKSLPTNKSQGGLETSIDEWASDVNSHFSEVEEMALVVE